MIVLHAVWTDAVLHLWGERCPGPGTNGNGAPENNADAEPGEASFAIAEAELRQRLGDLWDSLLVSGASASQLALRIPFRAGRRVPSVMEPDGGPADQSLMPRDGSPHKGDERALSLVACRLPTLAVSPTDAIDLLTCCPTMSGSGIRIGDSFRYWSRVASLVMELMAKQQFVPAVHCGIDGQYRGFWRVVVDDLETSRRLGVLIETMPPVCRSFADRDEPVQASRLVENFLWTTVDSLVRRCLEGDELAHAIQDRPAESCSLEMSWLQSLVRISPTLQADQHQCREIHERVRTWLSRLDPPERERTCRTIFRLHAPDADAEPGEEPQPWRITLHVQATSDRTLVVDADRLWDERRDGPAILERPFDNAREQLREDVGKASRHFPPLSPCAEPEGPLECQLTLDEAYRFLRDAVPVLEAEGFVVWLPKWWHEERPRLRMHLEIGPLDAAGQAGQPDLGLSTLVAFDWRVALEGDDLSEEEITKLAAAKASLVRLRGRWVEVQPPDVQAALRFLQSNRSGRATLLEALRLGYVADDLETGLPVVGLRAHGWVENLLNTSLASERIELVDPPAAFEGVLRPYQLRGVQWLRFLSKLGLGACLADDMGLGKTIQLIALWLLERQAGDAAGPTLLIVPMSLVGNWQREIARFGPTLRVMVHHGLARLTGQEFLEEVGRSDVVISTYGLVHRDLEHLQAVDWHRIALDEAQNIKNPAAKQARAVRALRAIQRVALTGTPLENRLSELWSIIDFLNPGYLAGAGDFRRRYAVPIERHHDTDRAQRLRHLIRPFLLRRLKTDPGILEELPAKLEMTVFCNLTREQAALYEAVVDDMLQQVDGSGGMQRRGLILATLVKLKQICNHPAQFLADGGPIIHRSGKCDRLSEMLDEVIAEGDRALIFTQFRQTGLLLQKHLQETLDRDVLFLHGGTRQPDRVKMIDRFQSDAGDAPLFILSLRAGGFGLNLTAASHVFHFDRWWNPAVEDQATDRAHRIGQDKQLQVHKFVCIGTLEERIAAVIEHKRGLAERIVGTGEDWLTELSTDDLRNLIRLSRDAVAEE